MINKPGQGKPKQKDVSLFARTGVVMLLALYLAVFVKSPAGVPHIHHGEEHQHDSCQQDACHLAIYHPGSKGACHHKFHFSKAEESCDLCKLTLPRHVSPPLAYHEIATSVLISIPDFFISTVDLPFVDFPSDRGPPFMI